VTRLIQAAGGLVFRQTNKGKLRILVVHRPSYDDWSLPTGKADPGESPEETAVREVLEETGYHCLVVAPLAVTRHRVRSGIKQVAWFAMRPLPDSPGFAPNDEIDEVRWVSRSQAKELLDYENDRALVAGVDLKGLAETGTLWLVRHTAAGDRNKWDGDDRPRPLTKKGRKQAKAIADLLAPRGIERIVSSPYDRCIQTVEPLAARTGTKVEISDALAEGPDLDATYELIDSLVGQNAVLCSHGDVIPAVINRLMWAGLSLESDFYCAKGSTWEVAVEGGKFTTGRYLPPPKV
jgi:8-oxo-dGTP diphosphatase